MLSQHTPPGGQVRDRPTLRRSVGLFRAFRVEQTDPGRFYGALADDSVAMLSRWTELTDRTVLDVGGGPGYFADAFAAAGARYAGVEPDAGELTARGAAAGNTVRGSGLSLPFADGSVDVAFSSNVLEHVPDPRRMAGEMVRVTQPGGLVVISWTPWLSPWGGHETSPWHYLGGHRAADRYERRHGRRPKNDLGRTLFRCPVGPMVRWARAAEAAGLVAVVDVLPRYHPWWAQWVVDVPGLREVVSWNAVVVLRRAER
ncbi:methyltransferase domain-containing protein [Phycicoccus sp. CSK15P-2]|uniref:class I SAM-dependent methyltransferase n=1 Tax=Phycicoccus sp. CSK15P-2 TaxID=2807627 RepID=UPI001951CA6B|nr:methyltransferase domain-containing protein [Phycicoccus sp. CSK15P-2]MBM6403797.1 methyltransferase domain-containing protein [Phycicoccus sp. CSK15P-2]